MGSQVGGPRPFFVSEFTLVLELFEHNFVEVSPYMGGGRQSWRTTPIFVSVFTFVHKVFVKNFFDLSPNIAGGR